MTVRRPSDVRDRPPPAALLDLLRALLRAGRVVADLLLVIRGRIPVGDPLHRIAGHIARADPARAVRIRTDRRQRATVHDVGLRRVPVVAPREDRRRRASSGVFPLRLGRECAAAPGRVRLGLEPGDAYPRLIRNRIHARGGQRRRITTFQPGPARRRPQLSILIPTCIDEYLIRRVGHLGRIDPVAARERNLVLWSL